MSGGSYDYIYCRLKEECDGRMYDAEMDDMIRDLVEVLHDLEWWKSADSSEDEYRATLTRFKAKWFKGNREERLKGYIDNQIGILRKQLYSLIGEPMAESKHSTIEELEQEPCEDCISKKAVLDKINEICFSREQESVDFRVSQGSNGQRDLIINFIENLPSVQSKPKTEVLDKIRAEIDRQEKWLMSAGYNAYNVDIAFNSIKSVLSESEE